MLLRRRRGSVRPRARRGRLRRWSRAGGRARKASAPILACGAPGGVPSRAPGEGCSPWPSRKTLRRAAILANQANTTRPARRFAGNRFDSENLARMMTVPLRKANDSHSTPRACARLVSKLHDACDASETRHHVPGGRCLREVRGDGSRRDARAKAAPDTSSFFVILCACPGIFARKKTRRRDPRSARARALVADTPILPPAPDPPAVARAPSSRAPRPSAAAPAPGSSERAPKTDGSSAKRPRQRRGSRAMAPRGGRACSVPQNTGWNPTRGN